MWCIRAAAATRPFPVNAFEAESRRLARFFRIGHTPGRDAASNLPRSSDEFPFTLGPARSADPVSDPQTPAATAAIRIATTSCWTARAAFADHWHSLIDGVFEDDARAARRATEFTRRMIVENGVTYNVYADAQGRDRPWILDPLPYLMTAQEWQSIEAGVAQRARLLNAVLADLYGKQELLVARRAAAGDPVRPSEFPLALRAACVRRGDRWLSLYARRPRALRRRALVGARRPHAGALGSGLCAREPPDRAPCISRIWRKSMDVRPLGAFFAALRDELLARTPARSRSRSCSRRARSTKPISSTPISRASSGFPLVEGHDLTVRDETRFSEDARRA